MKSFRQNHPVLFPFLVALGCWFLAVLIAGLCISLFVQPSADSLIAEIQQPYDGSTRLTGLSPFYRIFLKLNPPTPVSEDAFSVTDEMVQAAMDEVLVSYAEWEAVEGRTQAQSGDSILVDYLVILGDEVLSVHNDIRLQIDGGQTDPVFSAHFAGRSVGETFQFAYESDELGQMETYQIEATLLDIQVQRVPEWSDSFAVSVLGAESAETFREQVRQSLITEQRQQVRAKYLRSIFSRILADTNYVINRVEMEAAVQSLFESKLALYEPFLSTEKRTALYLDCYHAIENETQTTMLVNAIAEREGLQPTAAEVAAFGSEADARYEKVASFLLKTVGLELPAA